MGLRSIGSGLLLTAAIIAGGENASPQPPEKDKTKEVAKIPKMTREEIARCVHLLGCDAHKNREKSHNALVKQLVIHLHEDAFELVQKALSDPDNERNHRADLILRTAYAQIRSKVFASLTAPMPGHREWAFLKDDDVLPQEFRDKLGLHGKGEGYSAHAVNKYLGHASGRPCVEGDQHYHNWRIAWKDLCDALTEHLYQRAMAQKDPAMKKKALDAIPGAIHALRETALAAEIDWRSKNGLRPIEVAAPATKKE